MALSVPTSAFNFAESLAPSSTVKVAETLAPGGASTSSLWSAAENLSLPIEQTFGPNAPDLGGLIGLDSSQFLGGLGSSPPPAWTFITAPEDVSWSTANAANRVDIFGTNNPPVVAGSRGMRDLTLGNALVEGFVRRKEVRSKIDALEALMNYGLNSSDGFVSVPVYQIWADKKAYGGDPGYFIIRDVRVKETMRDTRGFSTRAYVDISLMQVPAYQVNTGRDQASPTTAGVTSPILPVASPTQAATQAGNQNIPGSGSTTSPTSPAAKPASGPSAPTPPPAASAPKITITGSGQPEIRYSAPPR
jgi:hypothetical protein